MFTKYLLPFAAIAGAIFAVVYVYGRGQPIAATQPVAPPPQAPFPSYVAGAGIVEASTENIQIGTTVPGVVMKIDHGVWDHVNKDEPLFEIDSRDAEAELAIRKAALLSAQRTVDAQTAIANDAAAQWHKVEDLNKPGQPKVISEEEMDSRRFANVSAQAKLAQTQADVESARANIAATEIELQRRIVRAPVDGTVLQCKVHLGEYAMAGNYAAPGSTETTLMMFGNTDVLNIRVDIDENDAWRVDIKHPAEAVAYVRGNRALKANLHFVRVEPFVTPKQSLTGDSSERVDTRVLQVLYSIDPGSHLSVYPGQQMDVFISAPPVGN
jgi:multidrug efflux pump subunit AcrA (membrane-fusion protein)